MKRVHLSRVTTRLVSLSLVVDILVGDLDQRDEGNPVDSLARVSGVPRLVRWGIPSPRSKYERWLLLTDMFLLGVAIALEVHKLLRWGF